VFIENSTITSLLTGCKKNHRESQRVVFLSLLEFAAKICYRYSGIQEDPAIPLFDGYIKLFKNIEQFNCKEDSNALNDFRNWFKQILIDTCIESGKEKNNGVWNLFERDPDIVPAPKKEYFQPLSPRKIIDTLRQLSFPYRMVYNLSVIDKFNYQDISSKLEISVDVVELNLKIAIVQLKKSFQPITVGLNSFK
jgi:RNA polymerase sigma factor (sigma-70 family)